MENTQVVKVVDGKKLTPVFSLIGKALKTYFKGPNLVYLIKLILVQILIGIVSVIPLFILFTLLGGASYVGNSLETGPFPFNVIYIPVFLLIAIVASVVGSWLSATQIVAFSQITDNKIIGIKETLKLGWQKVWKFLGVSVLAGLIVMVGFLLFVIPGLIFAMWFSFSLYLVVDKNLGSNALGKSKALVSGLFWPIFGRYILFCILYFAISLVLNFIPIVGPILSIFIGPFYTLLGFLLYKDLLRVKEG